MDTTVNLAIPSSAAIAGNQISSNVAGGSTKPETGFSKALNLVINKAVNGEQSNAAQSPLLPTFRNAGFAATTGSNTAINTKDTGVNGETVESVLTNLINMQNNTDKTDDSQQEAAANGQTLASIIAVLGLPVTPVLPQVQSSAQGQTSKSCGTGGTMPTDSVNDGTLAVNATAAKVLANSGQGKEFSNLMNSTLPGQQINDNIVTNQLNSQEQSPGIGQQQPESVLADSKSVVSLKEVIQVENIPGINEQAGFPTSVNPVEHDNSKLSNVQLNLVPSQSYSILQTKQASGSEPNSAPDEKLAAPITNIAPKETANSAANSSVVMSVPTAGAYTGSNTAQEDFMMADSGKQTAKQEGVAEDIAGNTSPLFASVLDQQSTKTVSNVNLQQTGQQLPQNSHDPYNIAAQIVENARLIREPYNDNNSQMVIKLKPEHLGELTLKVAVDNGVVSASFHTNNADVRGIIESSLQQLKQDMASQGLKVDNVGVYAGLGEFLSGGQQEAFKQQQPSIKLKNVKTDEDFIQAIENVNEPQQIDTASGVDYRI